jgi:hypothetical protein
VVGCAKWGIDPLAQLALAGNAHHHTGPKAQIGFAVSLGQFHAYQTISEVAATSTVPKNT